MHHLTVNTIILQANNLEHIIINMISWCYMHLLLCLSIGMVLYIPSDFTLETRSKPFYSLSDCLPFTPTRCFQCFHDDFIKENIFRVTSLLCGVFTGGRWIPWQSLWRGALMFSLICVWTNNWANNEDAVDLSRHRAIMTSLWWPISPIILSGLWYHSLQQET